jgi:hypothetical protein
MFTRYQQVCPFYKIVIFQNRNFRLPDSLMPMDDSAKRSTGCRDLKYAGIEKRDVLNRVLDVHALRHTHAQINGVRSHSRSVEVG